MPRRLIAYTLLLWYLPACTAWHVVEGVRPEDLIATKPADVRVTRPDSTRIVLHEPSIAGDSLSGARYRMFPLSDRHSSVAVSDVTQIEIRRFSAGKTVVAVALTAAIGLVVGIYVALANLCILDC
jgi:hypothetical protein